MRRLYTADGQLDREQLHRREHPDETLVRLARDHMAKWKHTDFRYAKQQVLKNDMEFAKKYHSMF